jgi:hypothetical protein
MSWPADVDGDVLRSLEEGGFDFASPALIDFNVDFQHWPPARAAIEALARHYPGLEVHDPEGEEEVGYLQFQVYALVTYELVMNIQSEVTELMAPFRGECSSWGLLVTPPNS